MKKGGIILLLGTIVIMIAVYRYHNNKKINKTLSDRLRQVGLADKDVSNLETEFLKAWVEAAEEAINRAEGGLPGWEYGKKFKYKGVLYVLKGGSVY